MLGRHRELDGLLQGVRGSARLRARRLRPVAEGEEPDLLHTPSNTPEPRLPGRTGHVNRSGRYVVSSGSDDFVSTAAVSRVRPVRMGA